MCARLDGVVPAVTAHVHQVPGELVVLILASVAMEQDVIMKQVSVFCVVKSMI